MNFTFEKNRIFALGEKNKLLAEVTFPFIDSGHVVINHVFVDEDLRGEGVASHLMELAYSFLKEQNLLVKATCPYAVSWFAKHPEKQDIVMSIDCEKGCFLRK
jgi:hypothetical protein